MEVKVSEDRVENLKLLIALPIQLGMIADYIGAHPEEGFKKWFKIIDSLDEVVGVIKVNYSELKNEVMNLNMEDKVNLHNFIIKEFDIPNDKVEEIVEKSAGILLSLSELVKEAIALFKNLK